ncbi:DUF1697 domain-containing protein [Luethyella okanaganae]|uniref:DUF1697 domain-containing protein n=1 Tax=Luethyella okanaganae TaxID=69372 RepID=A0ABW1VEZ3_9MICO
MTRFIALLRGVNVGGITVTSAELAELFRGLGFDDVRTVLASGNVRFDVLPSEAGAEDTAALKRRIESALRERFGYEAWIVLVSSEQLAAIVEGFPFDAKREGWHPYVLFSSASEPLEELLAAAPMLDDDDVIEQGEGVIYWHNRRAVGVGSAFSKLSGKARYRSSTTNRNLRTLCKLLD